MKTLLYILILAAVLLIPNQGTDVGKLIPVEVVALSENGGSIVVRTDTGNRGEGETLEEAIRDLKETASGVIYLDTAEYLLLEPAMDAAGIEEYLKGDVKVLYAAEDIGVDGIANYLSVHRSKVRLKDLPNPDEIPTIVEDHEQFRLNEK